MIVVGLSGKQAHRDAVLACCPAARSGGTKVPGGGRRPYGDAPTARLNAEMVQT
jgi:hypothetical protein